MENDTRYFIPLSKSVLLFFPSRSIPKAEVNDISTDSEGYVVQVTIKQARRDVIKEMTTFFLVQHEITKAVESVVFAHIFTSLPPEIRIEGEGYVLTGRRKPWDFGKTLSLRWGEKPIKPCEEKWMFVFELVGSGATG